MAGRIHPKQGAHAQEENIDHHEHRGKAEHVLFGFPDIFQAQVLLHQILVEARHGNRNKQAAQKSFNKMKLASREIIEKENFGVTAVLYSLCRFKKIIMQALANEPDG